MAKTSTLLVVVALAVIVVGIAAYFLLFAAPPPSSQNKSVTLTLSEIREGEEGWQPSTIYLKKGDTVQLTVVNGDDDFNHSLAIPGLGIQTEMIPPQNGKTTVKFPADRVDTFSFNDPESKPDCKPAPPEEVSRRDIAFRVEKLAEDLSEAKSMSDAKPSIDQLKGAVNQYKEVVPADIVKLVADLEKATTINEVMGLTEKLEDAADVFLESLAPPCIKPGQIIIQP